MLLALDVSSKNLITIAVLALLFIVLYFFSRRLQTGTPTRSDRLGAQYAVLTAEGLAATTDQDLAEAVVANVLAKQDKHRPDLYTNLPLQTPGRCAVAASWLTDRELANGDVSALFASPTGELTELAADGCARLGAVECAAALRAALAAETAEEKTAAEMAYRAAREVEDLPRLWVTYIRENAGEFLDIQTETKEE